MKRIFIITIVIACFASITGIQGNAQVYAKVTVYTNTQQDVVGMLYQHRLVPNSNYTLSFYFSFGSTEGQTVDGGYMYQKWVLLEGFGFFPQVGDLYDLDEIVYGKKVESRDSHTPQNWPTYLNDLPGIDFRNQGGE